MRTEGDICRERRCEIIYADEDIGGLLTLRTNMPKEAQLAVPRTNGRWSRPLCTREWLHTMFRSHITSRCISA